MSDQTPDEALAIDTYVKFEAGRWVVYMDVIFWTETVHHRIQDYGTERQAQLAATWIKRGARRDLKSPPTGF